MRTAGFAPLNFALFVLLLSSVVSAAHAKIEIEINGVSQLLENNVRAYLSLTRYANRDDLTSEVISRIERRITAETREALQPLGYYAPIVKHKTTKLDGEHDWRIHIDIDPGYAVLISQVEIKIEGEGSNNSNIQAVIDRQDLKPGGQLDHGVYEKVKAELLRAAVAGGYLEAKLTRNELTIDPVARQATAIITVDTGPLYRFGAIEVHQPVIKDSMARRLLRMHEGDAYTADALLESQYMLNDSQYFAHVELQPGDPDADQHTVPLDVNAEKNKRNSYALSGGYGTDTRARGKLTWDNRYLNDSGHRSQVEATASSIKQEISTKYIIPVMDIALEKLQFELSAKKEELGDILSRKIEFATGLTQVFYKWQNVLFVRLSKERDDDKVDPTFLVLPGISIATLPPSPLDHEPRRYSLYAELTGSPKTLGSNATFLQFRLQGERVFDLSLLWHLRTRGEFGTTWSENFDSVPTSNRFFAGGDNSIRGFGLNELSPLDKNGVRAGAPNLIVASLEIERDLPRDLGVSVFVDGGNAVNHLNDELEYSVGVGLRYRIVGVASLGVDVAQALSEPGRAPHFHLNLSTLF
jgi:translocation and assembly module TamA